MILFYNLKLIDFWISAQHSLRSRRFWGAGAEWKIHGFKMAPDFNFQVPISWSVSLRFPPNWTRQSSYINNLIILFLENNVHVLHLHRLIYQRFGPKKQKKNNLQFRPDVTFETLINNNCFIFFKYYKKVKSLTMVHRYSSSTYCSTI